MKQARAEFGLIALPGLFCVYTYFRVIFFSNNNRPLHKHLL